MRSEPLTSHLSPLTSHLSPLTPHLSLLTSPDPTSSRRRSRARSRLRRARRLRAARRRRSGRSNSASFGHVHASRLRRLGVRRAGEVRRRALRCTHIGRFASAPSSSTCAISWRMVRSSCPCCRSVVSGRRSIAAPSVAPETHHGWPVARPKLSTVGCTVTRTRAGGMAPVALHHVVRGSSNQRNQGARARFLRARQCERDVGRAVRAMRSGRGCGRCDAVPTGAAGAAVVSSGDPRPIVRPGIVELQDLIGGAPLQRALAGADHAQSDAVAEAAAAESDSRCWCGSMSKAVLLIDCKPATRPTAIRNSWPLDLRRRETVDANARRRDSMCYGPARAGRAARSPRRPAARSARSISLTRTSLSHPGSSSSRIVVQRCGAVAIVDARRARPARPVPIRRRTTPSRRQTPAGLDTAACARSWPPPRAGGRRRRSAHDLAVRGVAQVEAFAAMAIAIRERERSRGNRERLLRRIAGPRLSFTCQHLRDVVSTGNRFHSRAAVGQCPAESDGRKSLSVLGVLRC